jgi:uncharacterized damage-inducible protein DinB
MPSPQLIDDYLAGVKTLRQAVAGMTREQLLAAPVPGKWSTQDVVCHLSDFEPIYAYRMKRILSEDRPVLVSLDQNRLAAALAYRDRDVEEELALVEQTRRQMARILRKAPADAWARTGIYKQDDGTQESRTVERFLTLITNHIPHHVKFIHEKRRALGLA